MKLAKEGGYTRTEIFSPIGTRPWEGVLLAGSDIASRGEGPDEIFGHHEDLGEREGKKKRGAQKETDTYLNTLLEAPSPKGEIGGEEEVWKDELKSARQHENRAKKRSFFEEDKGLPTDLSGKYSLKNICCAGKRKKRDL